MTDEQIRAEDILIDLPAESTEPNLLPAENKPNLLPAQSAEQNLPLFE